MVGGRVDKVVLELDVSCCCRNNKRRVVSNQYCLKDEKIWAIFGRRGKERNAYLL